MRVIPLIGAQPVERHGEWGEKGEEQRKERATVIRRDGGTKTEGKRDRDGQRETHTHTEKQRQCRQKGRGTERTGRGETQREPRSKSQNHKKEIQRQGQKGRREGAGNPRPQVEAEDGPDRRQKGQAWRPQLVLPPRPLLPRQQVVDSPGGQEQDAADSQVGQKHEEPHSRGEGVQEGKVARLAALVGDGMRAGATQT